MKKTDKIKFPWPENFGGSSFVKSRNHCRKIYKEVYKTLTLNKNIIVCFSAGIDSTVLAHSIYYSYLMHFGIKPDMTLVYINHQFRSVEDIEKDINYTKTLANKIDCKYLVKKIICDHNQASARQERYNALANEVGKNGIGYLGHHANDIVETKLFQFLTGRNVTGIAKEYSHNNSIFVRPFLKILRDDIKEYARLWNLEWSEDCTNATDEYTRNRIRNDLIPWIEKNVNKGIVNTLSK